MTSHRSISPVRSVFNNRSIFENRSIVAQEIDSVDRLWCAPTLSIPFQQEAKRGIITISLKAGFSEYNIETVVHLRLPVEHLAIDILDDAQTPTLIRHHLTNNKPKCDREIFVLSLCLRAPGIVLIPENEVARLTPQHEHRDQIRAFQRLCKATNILLYIPKHGLQASREAVLQVFTDLATRGELSSLPLERARMYAGCGARQSNADIFNIQDDPPPYQSNPHKTTGKRQREGMS